MTQRNRRNVLPGRRGFKARGEQLDSRFLLSGITVVVTNTGDSVNAGTLRSAITRIDIGGDATSQNIIDFNIPKSDPGQMILSKFSSAAVSNRSGITTSARGQFSRRQNSAWAC